MKNNKRFRGSIANVLKKSSIALTITSLSQISLAATVLENGTPLTGISGASGSTSLYTLDVEAGATALNFNTTGGAGDADLYVKFGGEPSSSSYDCRPYVGGNEEACDISNIQEGTYHVMIQGYSTYSGLTLNANYNAGSTTPPPPPPPVPGTTVLENGVVVNSLGGAATEELAFTMEVPSDASNLSFALSGGTGDVDLHVKFGSAATSSNYDCRPYKAGNNETCDITNIQAGTYHVMMQGYSAFSGVSLVGSFNESGGPDPVPGPVAGVQNTAAAGDSITRAFAADCTYNSSFWGLLCPGSGDQPQHSWFDGSSPNVNSVHDRYKLLDGSITANKDAATTGAEMVGIREDGPEPSFGAQAVTIAAQSPAPDHVELIFGGNDLCSRDCVDPENCDDPIYTAAEWRQALRGGINTLMSSMPQGSSILLGSVPRVQDIRQAGVDKQAADQYVDCDSIWSSYDVCSIVTQPAPLNGETLAQRLAGVAAAQQSYNAILAEEAAAYNSNANGQNPNGIEVIAEYVDENTPSGGTFAFGAEHINGGDCFHPNVATQSQIADYMWNANTDMP